MERKHASKHWPNSGMRDLQAQINELWRAIEQLTSPPMISEPLGPGFEIKPGAFSRHNSLNMTAAAEVAEQLKPDAYQVEHLNYGWYRVVNSEGEPIHEGKLRKDAAQEIWQEAMDKAPA